MPMPSRRRFERSSAAAPLAASKPSAQDWRLQLSARARRRLRVWLWSVAGTVLAVLLVGGITRLTLSGLSMVEWQPLVGAVPPLSEAEWLARFDAYKRFPEYQQLRQGMTLDQFKVIFFWEYLHRLLARLIGVVFLLPFIGFWRAGWLSPPLLRRLLAILGLGAVQGLMGWVMVRSGLVDRPSVSHYRLAAHLVIAFVIFGLCAWVARDLAIRRKRAEIAPDARGVLVRGLSTIGVLLAGQVVFGALVAGLKAGFLFGTFPLMAGHLVPLPQLLAYEPPIRNAVENPATVQWIHRLLGTTLLFTSCVFFHRVRCARLDLTSRRFNAGLLGLVIVQYALGVATLLGGVPVGMAAAHQATAMAIAGVWVAWVHHVRNLVVVPPWPQNPSCYSGIEESARLDAVVQRM
jgi:cytochrome c oxidase assembly protein subunit 15